VRRQPPELIAGVVVVRQRPPAGDHELRTCSDFDLHHLGSSPGCDREWVESKRRRHAVDGNGPNADRHLELGSDLAYAPPLGCQRTRASRETSRACPEGIAWAFEKRIAWAFEQGIALLGTTSSQHPSLSCAGEPTTAGAQSVPQPPIPPTEGLPGDDPLP
jgi:hypothetical protein